jgi:ABC-type branched-subunit amino acid transport system permease subunit
METLVAISLMLSIVVLAGYIGQVSLAQLTFAGFAAFMLARFADQWGLPFPISPLLAIAVTTVVGTLIGIPALRIRGIQYAIVTLAAAVAIEQVLFRNPGFVGVGGLAHVDPPELLGVDLGIIGPGEYPYRGFGFLALGVTLACLLLVVNIRRSAVGRRFLAVRINERAAAAAGIDVARTKLTASAVASFLAAVSGVLFAYKNVDFSQVGLEASRGLQVLALAYLGGVGSVAGAIIAGLLTPAGLFAEVTGTQGSSTEQFLLTGIGLVIVATRLPGGIAGAGPWLGRTVARLRRRPHQPSRPPGPDQDGLPSVQLIDPLPLVGDQGR